MQSLAIIFGLAAGLCYAFGAYLQHKIAAEQPPELSLSPKLLVQLVQAPLWTLGLLLDLAAFGFEAAALANGSVTIVQPLMLTGLLFSLPVSAFFDKQRLGRYEWTSGIITIIGLTLFIVFGDPQEGHAEPTWVAWALAIGVIAAIVITAVAVGRRHEGATRAFCYAIATAACYGLTAALTKVVMGQLEHGVGYVFTSWEIYADAVVGILGLTLNQSAFQAGHLAASLPTVGVCAPIASIIVGRLVLDETFGANTPMEILLTGVGLVAMLGGAFALARSPLVTHEKPERDVVHKKVPPAPML